MSMSVRLIFPNLFLFYFIFCSTTPPEVRPEDIEFSEGAQDVFYSVNDKRSALFLQEIEDIQKTHVSFQADFSLRIDRYFPKREKFFSDGKIYFSRDTSQLKIQLMDNYFGMVFTEILAKEGEIRIRSSRDEKTNVLPMGDLSIYDPGKEKYISIPFPVIYYSVAGNFLQEFREHKASVNPRERRVSVRKGKDEFLYFFEETKLTGIEWYASSRDIKAILKIGEEKGFPPRNLVTKILEGDGKKETVLIVTTLRNIKKTNPPASVFHLP